MVNRVDEVLLRYGLNETRSSTRTSDLRALFLSYYRDGQRMILKEALYDLDHLISTEEDNDRSS